MLKASELDPYKLTKPQLEEKIIEVLKDLESIGLDYNQKKYTLDYLKHTDIVKTIMDLELPLPGETYEVAGKNKELSVRDREAKARTSEKFKIHMRAIKSASQEFAPIKHKYDSLMRLYETLNNIFLKRQA